MSNHASKLAKAAFQLLKACSLGAVGLLLDGRWACSLGAVGLLLDGRWACSKGALGLPC